jgi:hypothetical protein
MSHRMLPLSFRPRSFKDLIGQEATIKRIHKKASKRLPAAWMFSGASGAGKTTIARILAVSLQCPHQKHFGTPCKHCWKHRSQFDIIEINSAEASGVAETEAVIAGAFYSPKPPSKYRVYIFDEAQKLSTASQNVLLKYFEDSPKSTVWMICTTESDKIIKTLRRRCSKLDIPQLKDEDVSELVRRAIKFVGAKESPKPLIKALLEEGQRSPGFIVSAVEEYLTGEKPEKAARVGEDSKIDTLGICRGVKNGNWAKIRRILQEAEVDDTKVIRASVGKYLRKILVGEEAGEKADIIAKGILELVKLSTLEDSLQFSGTAATLYKLSQHFLLHSIKES